MEPVVEQHGTGASRGGVVAKAADDWGEGGHGLPEVWHQTAVGKAEEDVVVCDVGGDGFFKKRETALLVGQYGVALRFDVAEEVVDIDFLVGVGFDVVVALVHLHASRTDGEAVIALARMGMDILDDDGHVVVAHGAEDGTVEGVELVETDWAARSVLAVELLKGGQVAGVDGIPVDGVDIPEGIAGADALPDEGELLGVCVVGQFVALADIGDVVRLFAAGAKKERGDGDGDEGLFHGCWVWGIL